MRRTAGRRLKGEHPRTLHSSGKGDQEDSETVRREWNVERGVPGFKRQRQGRETRHLNQKGAAKISSIQQWGERITE